MSSKPDKRNSKNKIYLKNLADEHDIHFTTYDAIMEQYDHYLNITYNLSIDKLKGHALMPWQIDLLRRLNPTDFQINTMKELDEYNEWHNWLSSVMLICAEKDPK